MSNIKKRNTTERLVLGAILTALVIVLQFMGSFIHLGSFSISLVLIPIVIGAATCGVTIGAWLGLVFGVVVLISGDAALFLSFDVFGTIVTVILKGVACGLAAGLVYKLVENWNRYVAVVAAAIVCPVVNTGVFVLGCLVFFMKDIAKLAVDNSFAGGAVAFIFVFLIGANFFFELGTNIILSPAVVRVLNLINKK